MLSAYLNLTSKHQQVSSASREVNQKCRDAVSASNVRCQENYIEAQHKAGNDQASMDEESGISQGTAAAGFAAAGIVGCFCPIAGAIIAAVIAVLMIIEALRH